MWILTKWLSDIVVLQGQYLELVAQDSEDPQKKCEPLEHVALVVRATSEKTVNF